MVEAMSLQFPDFLDENELMSYIPNKSTVKTQTSVKMIGTKTKSLLLNIHADCQYQSLTSDAGC
jgi:hypothetical protein